MVIKSLVVTRNENIGIYCDLREKEYYVFCLDAFALRATDSSLNKVLSSIVVLNKLIETNDIACVDMSKGDMRPVFFFANIETGKNDDRDNTIFRFKLKNDNRYHQLDRKTKEWKIYSDENYTTPIESIESIRFQNAGSTFLRPYLNSTLTVSLDLQKYISNDCLTDDEIYKINEALKTKWSLRISIGTAVVAVLTLLVNTIATIDARKNAVQANESSSKSVELSLKATELVSTLLQERLLEQKSVKDSIVLNSTSDSIVTKK